MAWTTPATWTAGQVLKATDLNTQVRDNFAELAPFFAAWTAYTPSWTNLTVGNATVTSKYLKVGRTVFYVGYLLWGSTTSATATSTVVSLPFTAADANLVQGVALISDAATRGYVGTISSRSTTTASFNHSESGNFGEVNSTNPFAWGTSDSIRWSVTYEATS